MLGLGGPAPLWTPRDDRCAAHLQRASDFCSPWQFHLCVKCTLGVEHVPTFAARTYAGAALPTAAVKPARAKRPVELTKPAMPVEQVPAWLSKVQDAETRLIMR